MPEVSHYRLSEDAVSIFHARGCYARRGDKVKLIARHGSCWIVEGKKGERFPVNESKLTPIANANTNQKSKDQR